VVVALVALLPLALLLPAGPAVADVATVPSPITLGRKTPQQVTIDVKGVPFSADLRADVNVGTVERLEPAGGGTRVRYLQPEKKFPQVLCLLLWRQKTKGVHVLRIPMLGRTVVTVRTRSYSKIVISVGQRLFGPHDTGSRGRRRVRLLVPPGADLATVRVTDKFNLKTTKRIAITIPAYNRLAMSVAPGRSRAGRRWFRITAAAATEIKGPPALSIDGRRVVPTSIGKGVWATTWSPAPPEQGRRVAIRAWIEGEPASSCTTEVELQPRPEKRPTITRKVDDDQPDRRATRRKLRGVVGLAVGMIHNTGAFFSPRASLELGLDYRLPRGWLGVRAIAGVSGAGQTIEGPAGMEDAESRVFLVPVGGGLTYALPLSHLTPYLSVSLLAQIVHASSVADYVDQQQSHVALAVMGLAGAERRLGPGLVFLQSGFLWSRIDTPQLELLAGGVIVEAGYRYQL
jgi:hypothetical protein